MHPGHRPFPKAPLHIPSLELSALSAFKPVVVANADPTLEPPRLVHTSQSARTYRSSRAATGSSTRTLGAEEEHGREGAGPREPRAPPLALHLDRMAVCWGVDLPPNLAGTGRGGSGSGRARDPALVTALQSYVARELALRKDEGRGSALEVHREVLRALADTFKAFGPLLHGAVAAYEDALVDARSFKDEAAVLRAHHALAQRRQDERVHVLRAELAAAHAHRVEAEHGRERYEEAFLASQRAKAETSSALQQSLEEVTDERDMDLSRMLTLIRAVKDADGRITALQERNMRLKAEADASTSLRARLHAAEEALVRFEELHRETVPLATFDASRRDFEARIAALDEENRTLRRGGALRAAECDRMARLVRQYSHERSTALRGGGAEPLTPRPDFGGALRAELDEVAPDARELGVETTKGWVGHLVARLKTALRIIRTEDLKCSAHDGGVGGLGFPAVAGGGVVGRPPTPPERLERRASRASFSMGSGAALAAVAARVTNAGGGGGAVVGGGRSGGPSSGAGSGVSHIVVPAKKQVFLLPLPRTQIGGVFGGGGGFAASAATSSSEATVAGASPGGGGGASGRRESIGFALTDHHHNGADDAGLDGGGGNRRQSVANIALAVRGGAASASPPEPGAFGPSSVSAVAPFLRCLGCVRISEISRREASDFLWSFWESRWRDVHRRGEPVPRQPLASLVRAFAKFTFHRHGGNAQQAAAFAANLLATVERHRDIDARFHAFAHTMSGVLPERLTFDMLHHIESIREEARLVMAGATASSPAAAAQASGSASPAVTAVTIAGAGDVVHFAHGSSSTAASPSTTAIAGRGATSTPLLDRKGTPNSSNTAGAATTAASAAAAATAAAAAAQQHQQPPQSIQRRVRKVVLMECVGPLLAHKRNASLEALKFALGRDATLDAEDLLWPAAMSGSLFLELLVGQALDENVELYTGLVESVCACATPTGDAEDLTIAAEDIDACVMSSEPRTHEIVLQDLRRQPLRRAGARFGGSAAANEDKRMFLDDVLSELAWAPIIRRSADA